MLEDLDVAEAEHLSHFPGDAHERGVVGGGVASVNGDVVFNGLANSVVDASGRCDAFERVENEGMVSDDEVATVLASFVDDIGGDVDAYKHSGAAAGVVAQLQSGVVVIFLIVRREYVFYCPYHIVDGGVLHDS